MKALMIALSLMTVSLGTAFAQIDPNAPTGPNNPNPPAQFAGQQVPTPCGMTANNAGNNAGAAAAQKQPQATQTGQAGAAQDKPSAGAGCGGQDHPAAGSTPAPAGAPHP